MLVISCFKSGTRARWGDLFDYLYIVVKLLVGKIAVEYMSQRSVAANLLILSIAQEKEKRRKMYSVFCERSHLLFPFLILSVFLLSLLSRLL